MVAATNLRWRWCGGVVVRCWREALDRVPPMYGWCRVWLVFHDMRFSDRIYKSVEICRILCWISDGFQIWWDLQVSLYPLCLFRNDVDFLEVNCELKLIWLGFHSTVSPSTFGLRSYFLDFDGPFTFYSRSGVRDQWHLHGWGWWSLVVWRLWSVLLRMRLEVCLY
jgi:hypothetical protein